MTDILCFFANVIRRVSVTRLTGNGALIRKPRGLGFQELKMKTHYTTYSLYRDIYYVAPGMGSIRGERTARRVARDGAKPPAV